MAQFDVYKLRGRSALVVDCQSNFCDYLPTRFVVPLIAATGRSPQVSRLNPTLEVEGTQHTLAVNAAATLSTQELGTRVGSLKNDQDVIKAALDQVIAGF